MAEATIAEPQIDVTDTTTPASTDEPEPAAGPIGRILTWGRQKAPETRAVWHQADLPPRGAPFEDYMAFYRSQHTTKGIRATHLVGIPGAAAALPILVVRPKLGIKVFILSWLIQVLGHKVFERNNPALTQGFFTFQFCGLAFWCEEMGDLAAGR